MCWHHLRSGEIDHERLWLFVSVACMFIFGALIYSGLPLPKCMWREMTGLPCPGCGTTRCAHAILSGRLGTAFLMNPFAFFSLVILVLYNVYAAIVLLFGLPRLRFSSIPDWLGFWSRLCVGILFALNWTWLIIARR